MRWGDVKSILCVRLDNMGDVLMTTPAFRALKESFPGVRLTLLTSHMGAGTARFIPEIDAVITFDVPWVKLDGDGADEGAILALVERLKAEPFDAAILFTVFSQNPLPAALILYMAGIPLRLGYCRENPYGLLTDWLPDHEPFAGIAHEVERQLSLVGQVGARTDNARLSLRVPVGAGEAAIGAAGIDPAMPWLVLHPGVSEQRRQYPPEGYVEAGRTLRQRGMQIVITGSASERALAERIASETGGVSLAGKLDLDGLIGLIDRAPLLISNNTGPVHIAAAVQTPVIVLYAHTNPQHTPWMTPNRVLYFDVPPERRSKNVLLDYTYRATVSQPVRDAQPREIVEAAL